MSRTIHRRFREIAGEISPALLAALSANGAVTLKPRRDLDLPSFLCRIVVGQQLSVRAARTIWGRVTQQAGDSPLRVHLATATVDDLRGCGMSRNKARTIKAIVEADREGGLREQSLARLDHATRSRQLTEIWGIGPWTADMVGIFYFANPDIWPANDVTVGKTLQRFTHPRSQPVRTAARFAPHRSYLAVHMWKIADAPPSSG